MRRQGQGASPARGKRPMPNSTSPAPAEVPRNSRLAPNYSPSSPKNFTPSALTNEQSTIAVNSRTGSRFSTAAPIIMTKAQLRRRNAIVLNSTNMVRTVTPIEGGLGPSVTARNATPTTASSTNAAVAPTRAASKRRFMSIVEIANASRTNSHADDENEAASLGTVVPVPLRVIRTRARGRADRDSNQASSYGMTITPSVNSIQKYRRIRNRVSFALPDVSSGKDSVSKALASEKILSRILSLMNWNELLPLRLVCKAWFETSESNPKVNYNFGVVTIRSSIESKMAIYNASTVTWTKFRFIGPIIFDMAKPVQNEFWTKHGPFIKHLEINNRAMSLTSLVEILARCPKLEFFTCNWTPEMYSFNSELIRKYYGIHFNNGTFAYLKNLTIECSSSLTDSALGSILKWCGGSIRSLVLTSPPDEDILTRLKPRWSIESIKNYYDRFGYTGNLQYLDFSWSNIDNDADIRSLCSMEMNLRGITLNYCKIDDHALRKLLLKYGETLEVLKIEGVPFTDAIFSKEILPKVKVLHIGGVKGIVRSLAFLKDMPRLEELSCHHTQWLEQSMILRPFNSKTKQSSMRCLDLGGGIKHSGNKNLDPNLNKNWFSDFIGLIINIKELNLSQWSLFGTNLNFKNICKTLTLLEKLVVRDWDQLDDVGTTGLYEEEIHQDWGAKIPVRSRVFVGQLQRLKLLDLSGTAVTDATVYLALYPLKNLRSIAIDGTRVTDNGLRGLISKIPSLDRISASKCLRISVKQPRLKRPDGRTVVFGKLPSN